MRRCAAPPGLALHGLPNWHAMRGALLLSAAAGLPIHARHCVRASPACVPARAQRLALWAGASQPLTPRALHWCCCFVLLRSVPTCSPAPPGRYMCVGYSAYDEEGLKRAAARRSSEADAVTLPYCEGLEVRQKCPRGAFE